MISELSPKYFIDLFSRVRPNDLLAWSRDKKPFVRLENLDPISGHYMVGVSLFNIIPVTTNFDAETVVMDIIHGRGKYAEFGDDSVKRLIKYMKILDKFYEENNLPLDYFKKIHASPESRRISSRKLFWTLVYMD